MDCRRLALTLAVALGSVTPHGLDAREARGHSFTMFRAGHDACILRADPTNKFTTVRAPLAPRSDSRFSTEGSLATVNVTYNGFTAEAQAAFQAAVNVWQTQLTSPVTINVQANWVALSSGVLGSAGPGTFAFDSGTSRWYPIALANKLAGTDLTPSADGFDVVSNFNSTFENWSFATDGVPVSGKYDFMTVVLHELTHGLGFVGLWNFSGGNGTYGLGTGSPSIYDVFLENNAGTNLVTGFTNGSAALGSAITTLNNVYFDGTNVLAANSGSRARLYTPATWSPGSSMSHLDEAAYAAGNAHSLMTPFLGMAEVIQDPGGITRGIFNDMGWTASAISPPTTERIAVGLGPYADGGWIHLRNGSGATFSPGATPWARIPWEAYNAQGRGSRVAAGDVDGDGLDELIVGLDTGGWIAVLDDAAHNFALMRWIQVPWAAYNAANGKVYPAAGDIDGDGRAEIVAGLGTGGAGWFAIFNDASAGYALVGWRQVVWAAYNAGDGSTRPAVANVNGTGPAEIILGLGPGSDGWIEVFGGSDSSYAHQSWMQVPWTTYTTANGETFVSAGDIDGDGRGEIVVGLGAGGGGWIHIFNDAAASYASLRWIQTSWAAFNNTASAGAIHPAVGDIDGDGFAEIVMGLGAFAGNGGWFEIIDDGPSGFARLGWRSVEWPAFMSSGAPVSPAIGKFR